MDSSGYLTLSQLEFGVVRSVLGGRWGLGWFRFSLRMTVLTLQLKYPVHEAAEGGGTAFCRPGIFAIGFHVRLVRFLIVVREWRVRILRVGSGVILLRLEGSVIVNPET
jgi:hypothetical protein